MEKLKKKSHPNELDVLWLYWSCISKNSLKLLVSYLFVDEDVIFPRMCVQSMMVNHGIRLPVWWHRVLIPSLPQGSRKLRVMATQITTTQINVVYPITSSYSK